MDAADVVVGAWLGELERVGVWGHKVARAKLGVRVYALG